MIRDEDDDDDDDDDEEEEEEEGFSISDYSLSLIMDSICLSEPE